MEADTQTSTGADSVAAGNIRDGVSVDQCQHMIQKAMRSTSCEFQLRFQSRFYGFSVCLFDLFLLCYFSAPMVKFLRENLGKAGCDIGDNFIKAVNCDQRMSGGYTRGDGVYSSQSIQLGIFLLIYVFYFSL